jgi:hypothetical protein
MYQNLQQLQGSPYYQTPYNQSYQRLAQMEQQQAMNNMYAGTGPGYIKGRPVLSAEEARVAQIDLDGSLFVFTDIANKKIYTKQITLDGTPAFNTYSLVEDTTPQETYVTKAELDSKVASIEEEINQLLQGQKEIKNDSTGFDNSKKPVCKQPAF